ncbi:TPA: hypothetical protein N0F65_006964 [Lagenidium giganteum]|uniref:rRNA-processing protein EFG1 n=1 Tax=Lagenidium giganteum TaxID=4803 RepID=A0AAV2ZK73_9STRA|nr:TPA: hypothetical protein N0F65_006964 [Lagenidium giganteum]
MAPTAGTRLRYKHAQSKKHVKTKKLPSLKNRIRGLERFLKRGVSVCAAPAAWRSNKLVIMKQHKEKEEIEQQKKNVEKYKKPRFFERVKVMRKLRQAQSHLETETDKKKRKQLQEEYEKCRQDLMYIFYYPKADPYISLFPSKELDEETKQRREELRKAAIARFEEESPTEAFHQFCFADKKTEGESSQPSAASLILKRPSKEMEKKMKNKKPRHKKDDGEVKKAPQPALVDLDDDDVATAEVAQTEDEKDDFFL